MKKKKKNLFFGVLNFVLNIRLFCFVGVTDIQADLPTRKVTVSGKTNPQQVLHKARKFDKKAEIVVEPPAPAPEAKAETKAAETKTEESTKAEKKPDSTEKKTEEKAPEKKAEDNKSPPKEKGETKAEKKSEEVVNSNPPSAYQYYYQEKPITDYWARSPYTSSYYNPYNSYVPSQSYPPNHYNQFPETDYSSFYTNPQYLKHIPNTY